MRMLDVLFLSSVYVFVVVVGGCVSRAGGRRCSLYVSGLLLAHVFLQLRMRSKCVKQRVRRS
jgi:hypothetical protein